MDRSERSPERTFQRCDRGTTRMHLSVVRPISIPFNSLRSSPNWVLAWWMTSVFTPSSVALAGLRPRLP